MNRDDIIRMAREQGLPETETEGVFETNFISELNDFFQR